MNLMYGHVIMCNERYTPEKVNEIDIRQRPDGTHFGIVGALLFVSKERSILLQQMQGMVTQTDELVEIEPRVLAALIIHRPVMFVEIHPEPAVPPVASTDRDNSFV